MSKACSQEYRGNGKHTWEEVSKVDNADVASLTARLRVPGGWLYAVATAAQGGHSFNTVFVPMPEVVKHKV